ncbi:hypothetical protein [Flavobacterium sp. HJJ]|uniref:hypothetical protein n=1 Tax=Flavobacterium sp. HJJ TaxID=2783792 RepID=UPI00188B45DA|nr:hypothetical protein [Flavobacterium sp. HJJ]MBF4471576.1 hypothetical protein [Flavobacterium sp. HJJ]
MKHLLISILFFSGTLLAQNTKYTIEINRNLYATDFDNNEYLYRTSKIDIKNSKKINQLISELKNIKSINQLFTETKIDTITILQNPKHLLKYYDNKYIGWNSQQVDYISDKLTQLQTYKKLFTDYLGLGCCVNMHQRYRDEYIIRLFENNILINTYSSRKSLPNTKKIPWVNTNNTLNYNPSIDKLFFNLFENKKQYEKIIETEELTKYLIKRIIDYNTPTLYELSAYDYINELNELKSDFEILKIGEIYGRGRYIWNEPKTYYSRLKNASMLSQINIMFLATKERESIYSRDSIKSNYKDIIKRVQSIDFIINYINKNPSVKLDIYYFNNKPINDYNIDNFNKNPIEWKKQDDYIESLNWYKKNNIKPSFDINEAIKTSERNHCGCNYRFKKDFVEKAIFIELTNKEIEENSIWFLLPDNTLLLYVMQGKKVLNYNYSKFGENIGIQYPCVLFDLNGNIIDKK